MFLNITMLPEVSLVQKLPKINYFLRRFNSENGFTENRLPIIRFGCVQRIKVLSIAV